MHCFSSCRGSTEQVPRPDRMRSLELVATGIQKNSTYPKLSKQQTVVYCSKLTYLENIEFA